MAKCSWCGKDGATIVISEELASGERVCNDEVCKVEFANSRGIPLKGLANRVKRVKLVPKDVESVESDVEPKMEDSAQND